MSLGGHATDQALWVFWEERFVEKLQRVFPRAWHGGECISVRLTCGEIVVGLGVERFDDEREGALKHGKGRVKIT